MRRLRDMYPMMMDSTYLLLIPALLLTVFAQMKVKSAFAMYSEVMSLKGVTAGIVSRRLLDSFGLGRVKIERVPGSLTDHYDPASKVLRLSDSVGDSSSIAAIGVAAHEIGHAMQDESGYAPLKIRNSMVPVANIGSMAASPLFIIGLVLGALPLINLSILLFSGVVLFHLVTLPVEFDASSRALRLLSGSGALTKDEIAGAKKVLDAAALTYVAAMVMALLSLARLLIIARRRRD
jgi:Zn-dependent membrane protease YugP